MADYREVVVDDRLDARFEKSKVEDYEGEEEEKKEVEIVEMPDPVVQPARKISLDDPLLDGR